MSNLIDFFGPPNAGSARVGAWPILRRYLALDDDSRQAEVIETLEEASGELMQLTNRFSIYDLERAAGSEALFDRLLKEITAHRFRFKGDEASELPASILRIVQRLTAIRL